MRKIVQFTLIVITLGCVFACAAKRPPLTKHDNGFVEMILNEICSFTTNESNSYNAYKTITNEYSGRWEGRWFKYQARYDNDIQSFIVHAIRERYYMDLEIDIVFSLSSQGLGDEFRLIIRKADGNLTLHPNIKDSIMEDLVERARSIIPKFTGPVSIT